MFVTYGADHEVQCCKLSLSSETTTSNSDQDNAETTLNIHDQVTVGTTLDSVTLLTCQDDHETYPTEEVLKLQLPKTGVIELVKSKEEIAKPDEGYYHGNINLDEQGSDIATTTLKMCNTSEEISVDNVIIAINGNGRESSPVLQFEEERSLSMEDSVERDSKQVDEMFAFINDKNHSEYLGNDAESSNEEIVLPQLSVDKENNLSTSSSQTSHQLYSSVTEIPEVILPANLIAKVKEVSVSFLYKFSLNFHCCL